MVSITHPAARNKRDPDDIDARCARIIQRILDGVEQTLDKLEQPDVLQATIARVAHAHIAPLFCGRALCRRARRCCKQPCEVPAANRASE